MSFQIPITVIPMITGGKLKAIALTGDSRLAALPQVPTFTEAGLPGYGLTGVTGIVAPAKTPLSIRNKIATDVAEILSTPSAREFLARQGAEPFITTSANEMTVVLREEMARYAKIIKEAGIKYQP
jgi:tripartite-type tricarboxylate transporter receptor subunit TctC